MTISLPWGGSLILSGINNLPVWLSSEIKEIELISQHVLSSGGSSSIDNHLHVTDHGCCMCCPLTGDNTLGGEFKFFPVIVGEIIEVGFVGDDKFASNRDSPTE